MQKKKKDNTINKITPYNKGFELVPNIFTTKYSFF